jgi:hypothetical protein
VLHHSALNYTHFGDGDRMRWLGFDLVALFSDSLFMACMFFISGLFVRHSLAHGERPISWPAVPGDWRAVLDFDLCSDADRPLSKHSALSPPKDG